MSEGGKVSASFFVKKEAKKLSLIWCKPLKRPSPQTNKSFLLLFYKKEALASLNLRP
jgi:hypothetical protein